MESKQPERKSLTLEKLRQIFLRRRRIIFLLFLSSTIVMILVVYLLPAQYETRVYLLVKAGQEALTTSSMLLPELSQSNIDLLDMVTPQIQILQSETLWRKVVDRMGVDRILGPSSPGHERTRRFSER